MLVELIGDVIRHDTVLPVRQLGRKRRHALLLAVRDHDQGQGTVVGNVHLINTEHGTALQLDHLAMLEVAQAGLADESGLCDSVLVHEVLQLIALLQLLLCQQEVVLHDVELHQVRLAKRTTSGQSHTGRRRTQQTRDVPSRTPT